MEGAGEGMVAIVQALRDAGLAVTLMSGRQRRSSVTALNQASQVSRATHAKSTVETSTSALPSASVDTAAQICDDRYTSSYQLAHCRARPSSPPVEFSEFPPQRPEPCRTQGNFEIGQVSGEAKEPSLTSAYPMTPQTLRNSFTSVDRGVLSPPPSSRCGEAFALSLRKYPRASRSQGGSSELVQRLLAYTQAKNFSKSSYHSRSVRSLRTKSESPKEIVTKNEPTNCVQTNTQTKAKESAPIPEREEKENLKEQIKRKKRVQSPMRSARDVRYRDNHINATYDYLKSTSPHRYIARAADVRYLSEMTRCLRDTLREICDSQPVSVFQVCPNIQHRYSRHRREHHAPEAQPSSDSNNTDPQASLPMVSTGVPAMSSCEAMPGTYQQTRPTHPKICCYCRKPLPCSCVPRSSVQFDRLSIDSSLQSNELARYGDDFENNVKEQVINWLQEVPVYANDKPEDRSTRKYMATQLVDKLKRLKDDEDFEDKAKAEIAECVSNMPMWCPGNKNDQELFKQQIADNLLNKILNVNKDIFESEISKWVESLNLKPTDSQGQVIEKQNITENLVNRLKPLALNQPSDTEEYKADLKLEIVNMLEDLPIIIDRDKKSYVNKLADKLATQLHTIPAKDVSKSKVDSGVESVGKEKGITSLSEDNITKHILDWVNDIPELAGGNQLENQRMVGKLAKKLFELGSQGKDVSDLEDEISNWLTTLLESKKERLDIKRQSNLINTLLSKITTSDVKEDEQLIQDIWDCLGDIPELDLSSQESKKMVEQLANKIQELQTQKQGDSNKEDMKIQIGNLLDNLIKKTGVQINSKTRNQLIQKLMNVAFSTPKPRKHWNKQGNLDSDHLKNTLIEEVALILNESNIHCDNRDEIESILTDVLADQVMRGDNEWQTKDRLISALRDSDIPKEQTEEIATKLIQIAKEVSLGNRTQDSTIQFSKMSKSREFEALSPIQKEIFQNSAEQEIIDYIQGLVGDSSVLSTKKYKIASNKLAQRIYDIMSEKDTPISNKREDMESEISKCLQSLSISTDGSQVSELADKFQNLAFKASTPKRSSLDQGFSFRPKRDSRGSTMSAIEDDSQFKMQATTPSKEEEQYMDKLVNIIDSWMSDLPIDLETEDGKGFRQVMIRDLAGEIIDRQKYLQLNPEAKTSDDEELEHLKYQVFRWLNKLPDVKEIIPSISKTNYLMERIKAVTVPQLIKTLDRSFKQRDSIIQNLSQGLSFLENEISKWIEAVPSKFYNITNRDYHQQMVKDLAEQIDQLHREEALTETLFFDVVSEWLQKTLKEYNEKYFNSLTEGLKGVLVNKGLISLVETSMLTRQSRHQIQENLRSYILDWLKEKPLYQRRLSIEKREQEQIVADLSKKLKNMLKASHPSETHRDKKVLDEIKSHLKKFPMESHLKLDEEFHHSTANDLLEYLKMLNMFQNITEIQSQSQFQVEAEAEAEDILSVLEEWIDSLPLQIKKTSVQNKKLDSLKQEFAKTLYLIKQQHPTPNKATSDVLKEEINNYLQKFPVELAKKKDQKFVSDKIDELHKKLLGIQSQLTASDRSSISVDDLKEVILTWAKKLPFQPGKSIEKFKSEVDKVAPKIKNTLSKAPVDGFENVKADLEKEIKAFFNQLPLQKNKLKDIDLKELTDRLNVFVKTSSAARPALATDSTFSTKSGFKKGADILYDNIKDWCENLPIQSGNSPEEQEKVRTLKQNIASQLTSIIGDLNMNPEIFNDDSLYEDLLNDEIDNLLSSLPPSLELTNNLPELKENLIKKIKEAKIKTQEELAGQAYKQQLREAISKTLPSVEDLSTEELAPFDVLKDNLADAYINLHYAAGNEDIKSQLKNKISDNINQFCNDYLQRYPASPVDPRKLNTELYNVLQKVPAPKDETIKSQVEQVRIKDEIHDWLKEIPLKEDQSPADLLQRNKIVTVLAKRLHDIEKEKENNPDIDIEELMQNEIKKLIKKLPIKPSEEGNVEEMVKQLISKLKSTEESRRFSVSNIRHSMDTADDGRPCEAVSPFHSKFDRPADQPAPSPADNRYLSQYAPNFPPSSLSMEDRAHLEKIRERNRQKQLSFKSDFPQCQCTDASVNPIPIDAESQTDVGPGAGSGSAKSTQSQISPCCQASSSQAPVSPQVVVKEYFWDSTDTTMREPCGQQGQSASFQGQNQPCRQQPQPPPQFSWPQSQVNLTPRFGQEQQPNLFSGPQGTFSLPDQTGKPQVPCMMSPPAMTMQPSYVPQQQRQPLSPCMSPAPQMPSQAPFMSHSQIRPPQSPCMSQPYSMPPQASRTQPYPSAPPCPMGLQSPSMPPQSPCIMPPQSPSPQMRSYMNQPQMPKSRSPCMTQYDKAPCMTTPHVSQPQMPPRPSRHIRPCQSKENQRRETRKPLRQPCFGSREISSTSSPFDTGPDADNGRFNPKVTRLGSLDDVPCTKNCGSQSPREKRSRASPDEDYDWTIRFPEDDGYWGTPCPKRRVYRSPNRSSERGFIKEKERREEKTTCRCRERVLLSKCMGRRPQPHSCQLDDESMKHCSKCCGAHCPHPSYLFFK